MKKLAIALLAGLALAGCKPAHRVEHQSIYHFADGRYGYHDATSDMWFYYMAMQNNRPVYVTGPTPSLPSMSAPAGWSRGAAPNPKELAEAEEAEAEVAVDAEGTPAAPEEAIEAEASSEHAEAQTSADGEGAAVSTTESSSSDAGSSDAGGGDAGGASE